MIAQHGLQGWQFGLNSARCRMGVCLFPHNGDPGRIELSKHSPDNKRAIVRAGYGYRGSKGDTIYMLNEAGQLHDRIDVHHEFVKK
jgi:hypothetical protein